MDEKLSWLFELRDQMSSQSQKIADAVAALEEKLDKADKATRGLGEEQKNAGEKSRTLGERLRDANHSIHDFRENVEDAASKIFEFGERLFHAGKTMIEAAANADKMQTSLELLLGKPQSEELLEYIDQIAVSTAHTREELTKGFQSLAFHGIDGDMAKQVNAAALDIEAASGGYEEALNKFGVIRATGRFSTKSLTPLGLDRDKFLADAAKITGDAQSVVEKKLKSGAYGGKNAVNIVTRAMAAQEGGAVGNRGLTMGAGVAANLHKLEGAPKTFYEGFAKTDGYKAFGGALDNMVHLLDPSSAFGSGISERLNGIFSAGMTGLFGDLAGPAGAGALEGGLTAILDKLDEVEKWTVEHKDGIKGFFEGVADAAKGAWTAVSWIYDKLAQMKHWLDDAADSAADDAAGTVAHGSADPNGPMKGYDTSYDENDVNELLAHRAADGKDDVGKFSTNDTRYAAAMDQVRQERTYGWQAAHGFADGQKSGDPLAAAAAESNAAASIDGITDALDIHSPSRVFERFGRHTAEGFARGMEDGSDRTEDAAGDLAGNARHGFELEQNPYDITPPRMTAASTSTGIHVTLQFGEIHTSGGEEGAEQFMARLDAVLPSKVIALFEQVAQQIGAR